MAEFDVITARYTDPVWGQVLGPAEISVHADGACGGDHCPIHNPSDHPLKDAPMTLRFDRMALIERQCDHGVGHPDPDSVAFLTKQYGDETFGYHGCDGCCA